MKKIFMFTSVHRWNDVRVFKKEAISLAKKLNIELHAPAEFVLKIVNGVKVYGLPLWKSRLTRIKTILILLVRILRSDADIFHFHDPELMFLGIIAKLQDKRVIYDIHENVAKQLLSKPYISSPFIKKLLSIIYHTAERIITPFFDQIIIAGNDIMTESHSRIVINNYPIISSCNTRKNYDKNTIIYLGGITKIRGVQEVAKAISQLKNEGYDQLVLKLVGGFTNAEFKEEFLNKYEELVEFLGWMEPEEAYSQVSSSFLGVVLYLPVPNHVKLRSNKVFEYMECSLPIIYSNFPDWRSKLGEFNLGLSVDPTKIDQIKKAIKYLIDNPQTALKMGENGRKAVENKYNWKNEEKKLFALYQEIK